MNALKKTAPPLPASMEELLSQYQLKEAPNINDAVRDIFFVLIKQSGFKTTDSDGDPTFWGYLAAVRNDQAEEGSVSADNVMAAQMIRVYARDEKHPVELVAPLRLHTITKALDVVTRRYNMSRKQRKNMIGGQPVEPDPIAEY